ncbi:RING finger domain-containing protein [Endozoicomonas sp. ALD040]|uniref:RING finger domain-containing protein n=1 Tax=Endozoicomonas sp. ALD040 TaxID=3403079 RepID=UPI003BAF5F6B
MNGTTPPGTPPGTPSPSAPYQKPTDNCPVCLESFAGREVRVLEDCRHMFHEDCLARWLSDNNICPMCRTSLRGREVQPVPAMPLNFLDLLLHQPIYFEFTLSRQQRLSWPEHSINSPRVDARYG